MLRGKFIVLKYFWGFSGGSNGKQSACNAGDPGLIPESGRSLSREDALEKRMVTHSSILAWRTAWTEEPGRVQSMGSQRVGCDFYFHWVGYLIPNDATNTR